MAFDLTSAKKASHDFNYPELTNCNISVEIKFDAALSNSVELCMVERASTFYVGLDLKIYQKKLL